MDIRPRPARHWKRWESNADRTAAIWTVVILALIVIYTVIVNCARGGPR